jgi:hypothetical protein
VAVQAAQPQAACAGNAVTTAYGPAARPRRLGSANALHRRAALPLSGMTAPLEGWKRLLEPLGPVRVERSDGTFVSYGARGKAQAVDDPAEVLAAADIQLVLYDEIGNTVRTIAGTDVIDFPEHKGPVIVVVVDDSVEPDPGDSVRTRG